MGYSVVGEDWDGDGEDAPVMSIGIGGGFNGFPME
jgi:hypothetical protein